MKSNKGFTLIEIAVVLAIIAILAAILTPIVTSYIDQARDTRANSDVKKIAEAVLLFKRDTGVFPAYNTAAAAKTGSTPDKDCLVSGTVTADYTTNGGLTSGGASFLNNGAWLCSTTGLLSQYLNVNSMGLGTSGGTGGVTSYRGPYLDGLNGADPWANPYIVNSANLAITGANSVNWAFALSAGPNGVLNTTQTQPRTSNFSAGTDDIAALIR